MVRAYFSLTHKFNILNILRMLGMKGESVGKLLAFLRLCGETISFAAVGFITAIIIGLSSQIFKKCVIKTAAVNFNLKNYTCKNMVSNVKIGYIGILGKINVDI